MTESSGVWTPQKKQLEFLSRPEYECLYGGAAGGGKSDALLAEAVRQVHIPHYCAILFRKTVPQLSELIDRSRRLYSAAFPGAVYHASEHYWQFPSGAKIYFGSMQYAKDRINYQGRRYDFIAFDELTHFTWEEYSYMFSRNRPSGPGTRVYIRAATNPGGIGHSWVKERFITAAPPLTPITEEYQIPSPDGKTVTMTRSRVFVPSTVFDNKILLQNNPEYLANLSMLPTADRDGRLYRIREYYGCSGRPNDGVRFEPARIAEEIRTIEQDDPNLKGRSIIGIADPSIFDGSRGRSVAEVMEKSGVYWRPGDNARIAGKMQYHYRLAFDGEGIPMLYIFKTCRNFIRTVPALTYDTCDVEDIDTAGEDHIYDECRYVLMHIPIKARTSHAPPASEVFSPSQSNPKRVEFLRM